MKLYVAQRARREDVVVAVLGRDGSDLPIVDQARDSANHADVRECAEAVVFSSKFQSE